MSFDHLPSFLKILLSSRENSANLFLGIFRAYSLGNFKKLSAMIFECSEGINSRTMNGRDNSNHIFFSDRRRERDAN